MVPSAGGDSAGGPRGRGPDESASGLKSFIRTQQIHQNQLKQGSIDILLKRQQPPVHDQAKRATVLLLPPGLINHGNTCYLNATLQVLLNLRGVFDSAFQHPELARVMAEARRPSSAGSDGGLREGSLRVSNIEEDIPNILKEESLCTSGKTRLFDALAGLIQTQRAAKIETIR